ncbi:MAG TPA: S9 family peptidase [Steroidobacteraceae bacterium]|jgi:dipeptidyl aminopeptidase/acylaminoacyl peptidase|nr:S9 family peptidase [Steroidobacteraceae bacterium]
MKNVSFSALTVALILPAISFAQTPTAAEAVAGTAVIPRTALFGNPEKAQARVSPDGKYVSFIAPKDGVLNVWVGPRGDPSAAKALTSDTKRGIRQHFWAFDNRHVLFIQDEGGDENWHLYAADIVAGTTKDLTPYKGIAAKVAGLSWKKPAVVAVSLNDRVPEWHDLWEVNLTTGKRVLIEQNSQEFGGYDLDLDLKPKLAQKNGADGNEIFRKSGGKWVSLLKYGQEDSLTTGTIGIEGPGLTALMQSSVGRDKSALVRVDLATGKTTVLGASDQADIETVWIDPRTQMPQAYTVNYLKPEITVLTPSVKKDVDLLSKELGDGFAVTNRSLDDNFWTVAADDALVPASSYLYDRKAGKLTKLFDQRPALAKAPLVPMQSLEIKARDGLTLVSYLSLPPGSDTNGDGVPESPVPLVVNVHGGPWGRDGYGFDNEHQWLANRGYAVLSVNYRGSTGFGKSFTNAGNKEWAGKMHDDLLDAIDWAVKQKVTTKDKVAIYGGSYGGYATLVGLTFTPDTFACGVDIVGPSNLQTLLSTIPPYWKSFFEEFATRVGDPRTEEGKKLLAERSPLSHVDAIKKPLLIGQGANDPRVKQAEADQIVKAMKAKNLPVTYVLYPDEGHGFARPANRTSFYAIAEGFLSQCLGGRYEPVGMDFKGSSLKVLEGAEHVPGLLEALK